MNDEKEKNVENEVEEINDVVKEKNIEDKVEEEINDIAKEIKDEDNKNKLIIIIILIVVILILLGIIGFLIYKNYNIISEPEKTENNKNNVQPVIIQKNETFHTINTMEEIYYDPINNVVCKYYQKANSINENKTGCMKWYAFLDKASSDKVKLILDHNIVSSIKWNDDNKNVSLTESNLSSYLDKIVSEEKWKIKPRLITADEVVQIIGYEQNQMNTLSDVRKIHPNLEGNYVTIWLDSKVNTIKPDIYNKSNYAWLYDYTNDCDNYGCNIEDDNLYNEEHIKGYWTSTDTDFGGSIWTIMNDGTLRTMMPNTKGLGIRPVIEVDRKIINGEFEKEIKQESSVFTSTYSYLENPLIDFDLSFLKLEHNNENKIYSPISIKFGLNMLSEFSEKETKKQIDQYLKNYNTKKYSNNKNIAFSNMLFIKDTFKDKINNMISGTLSWKYNASIIYDSFESAEKINELAKENTFGLIGNLVDDVTDNIFVLINSVAIDMDWVNKISYKPLFAWYSHEKAAKSVYDLDSSGYRDLEFGDSKKKVSAIEFGVAANKYDIVTDLGEENIRKTVKEAYTEWLKEEENNVTYIEFPTPDEYIETYMKELKDNYQKLDTSTDFYFYVDDDVKVFAKDLKEYSGIKLEYVSIMPNNEKLSDFVNSISAEKINNYIKNLKNISLDSFKDGVITFVNGFVPIFNFDYELNVMNDLKTLGITDVFDIDKADLSNLTKEKVSINKMLQKAKIDFSNEGIKAAAALVGGGYGGGDFPFDYVYDVPVEEIDLTFDKPFMFIIRDKNTGEVWFVGTVYEPTDYQSGFNW